MGLYEAACTRSRQATGDVGDLNTESRAPSLRRATGLRSILVHMIEETAHHARYLDLLRNAIDAAPSAWLTRLTQQRRAPRRQSSVQRCRPCLRR